jgi:hypothetical protein
MMSDFWKAVLLYLVLFCTFILIFPWAGEFVRWYFGWVAETARGLH